MKNRYLPLLLFVLLALGQLYVPAAMILNREEVLANGHPYKFQVAPLDPSDPFRGKYITLRYRHNTIDVADAGAWESGQLIYVLLRQDRRGFARIHQVSQKKPQGSRDYVQARIAYVSQHQHKSTLIIDYPFDRYYLEESKALPAEQAYAASLQDTTQVTYALVHIKAGDAVLKEVMIGGIPIREKVTGAQRQR
jgi:uncharacterized membrane-anchored protein